MPARFDRAWSHDPIRSRRPMASRLWLAALAGVVGLGIGWSASEGLAAASGAEPPGRYLLLVDTSFSMRRNAENLQNLVGNLVASGMSGELRAGDTIGMWTFNDQLQAGNFPLQRWTPQTRQSVARSVVEFLQRQRYEGKTQLDKVLGPMARVVRDSEKITVVLITDGEEKFSGTPFDAEINTVYRLNVSEQRRLRTPFVTILRAQDGEFVAWKVSTPPWPVEFPEFPARAVVAAPEPRPPEPEPKPAARPLIVIPPTNAITAQPPATELRPDSEPAVTPPPTQPAETESLAPQPTVTVELPERVVAPVTQSPPAEPVEVIKTEPPPEARPTPPEPTTAAAPPLVVTPPDDKPAPVIPVKPAQPVQPTPSETTTAPAAPVTEIIATPQAAPPTETPITVEARASRTALASVEETATLKTEPDSPALVDAPVAQTAVVTPTESLFSRTHVLIAGVGLMVVALALLWALTHRTRATPRVSLITRSMDREQK
ncbi:MAG: VWA domain-containing protein [Verrucomicrobiae bacterium]|nr:VWA domain-containing protein [Verrucomicrobiae bacterium]